MPIVTLVLLVVVVALLVALLMKTSKVGSPMLGSRLDAFEKAQERTERAVREEVAQSRDELGRAAKEQRQELTEAFKVFGDSFAQRMMDVGSMQKAQLDVFSGQLSSFTKLSGESVDVVRAESAASAKQLREEVVATLTNLSETMTGTMRDWATLQKTQLDDFSEQLGAFARASGTRLDGVRAESATGAKQLREEVVATLRTIAETITNTMSGLASTQTIQFEGFANQLASFAQASGEKLDGVRAESTTGAKHLREEVVTTLNSISETMAKTIKDLAVAEKIQLEEFSGQIASLTKTSSEKLDGIRAESATGAQQLREGVVTTLNSISETMATTIKDLAVAEKVQLETFAGQIATLTKTSGDKLDGIRTESATGGKQLREEVIATLKGITDTTTKTMGEVANVQKGQLEIMSSTIAQLSDSNEKKLEAIRLTVEGELRLMQSDNSKQLEQMRQTVDEKLQGTLEKRLGESFKQVSERLEQVHKGLGEMQTLATGVGDLKKVLTNVKTRGTWGEVQLGTLLEQVLNPDQFAANVSTKDAGERVEFAVKLPGQGTDKDETLWLPIDAKFPIEDYQRLMDAQERADVDGVEVAGKQLENRVKACARTISEKYLNPPKTTDFGILFLPIEGLFAEVIRRTGLIETIQRESRVIIAGPTTLWSILNSLQMGFRTLAIQKRSSEVWNLLAAVKTEWMKYGEVLEGVQRKLHQASETIEKAKVRSRAIGRKLSDVQELPADDAKLLLPNHLVDDDTEKLEADEAEDTVVRVPLSPEILEAAKK
jgi:DNA recombination protein RmuC